MTAAEYEVVAKELIGKIDRELKEAQTTLEEMRKLIESLLHAKQVTINTLEAIKPYLIG